MRTENVERNTNIIYFEYVICVTNELLFKIIACRTTYIIRPKVYFDDIRFCFRTECFSACVCFLLYGNFHYLDENFPQIVCKAYKKSFAFVNTCKFYRNICLLRFESMEFQHCLRFSFTAVYANLAL